MWNKMFSKKYIPTAKKEKIEVEELLNGQNVGRTEPLKGTEEEIKKQAEEGMERMDFTPVEEKKDVQMKDDLEKASETQSNKWKPRVRGNDYCPCGDNKKFKKCCYLDKKKVEKLEKKFDIRLATAEIIRKLKNENNRKKKKSKILEKIIDVKV